MFRRYGLIKICCLIAAAVILILVPGCSAMTTSAKSLMTPPSYSEDQQKIISLMSTGEGHTDFAYPNSGQYRSAVIMRDITGDGVADAVGFIHNPKGITVKFMQKDAEGNWGTVAAYDNSSAQIDRVLFGDVNGDGRDDIVVGWGSPDSMTAKAAVYIYDKDKVKEFYLGRAYNAITLTDLNSDDVKEIFIATVYSQAKEDMLEINDAEARLYTCEASYPILKFSTELSRSIVKYTGITAGRISEAQEAVVLEGIETDFSVQSQVVCLNTDKTKLVTPMSGDEMMKKYNNFRRPSVIEAVAHDVDGDGILEFPKATLTVGHTKNIRHHPTAYMITWTKLEPYYGPGRDSKYSFEDYQCGFSIEIPEQYKDRVIVYKDKRLEEFNFYLVKCDEDGQITHSEHIFKIKIFSKDRWVEKGSADKFIILRDGDQVIAFKSYTDDPVVGRIPYTFEDIK